MTLDTENVTKNIKHYGGEIFPHITEANAQTVMIDLSDLHELCERYFLEGEDRAWNKALLMLKKVREEVEAGEK